MKFKERERYGGCHGRTRISKGCAKGRYNEALELQLSINTLTVRAKIHRRDSIGVFNGYQYG